jgi:hypothetical protein
MEVVLQCLQDVNCPAVLFKVTGDFLEHSAFFLLKEKETARKVCAQFIEAGKRNFSVVVLGQNYKSN